MVSMASPSVRSFGSGALSDDTGSEVVTGTLKPSARLVITLRLTCWPAGTLKRKRPGDRSSPSSTSGMTSFSASGVTPEMYSTGTSSSSAAIGVRLPMTSSGSSSSRLLVTTITGTSAGTVTSIVRSSGATAMFSSLGDVVALQVDGAVGLLLAAGPRRVLRAVAGEDVVDRGLGVGARRARARSSRRSEGSRCRRPRPCDRRARRRTGRRRSTRRSAGSGGRTSCWCACGTGCRRRRWARGPRCWPRPGSRRGTARRPSRASAGSTRCTGSASVSTGPITAMSAKRSTPTTFTASCSSSPMVTFTSSNGFTTWALVSRYPSGRTRPLPDPSAVSM